jgi:hypothetical protein
MFNSVTQVLGGTCRFGFSVAALTIGDVDAVAVGNSSSGVGSHRLSMPRTVSIGNQQRTSLHTQAFADVAPVSTRFQLRFGEVRVVPRSSCGRGQTHQERKDLLRQVLRNFIVRLQFLSDRGAHGAASSCFRVRQLNRLIA